MDRFDKAYEEYLQNGTSVTERTSDLTGIHITAVRKNDDGDLIAFKTNIGEELDYIEALDATKSGKLSGVDIFHKYGRDIIRSEPDGTTENNLDNLPEF
ncbi:MAG: DUF3892 domain-containing protein [Anaerobacillus sp.]